MEIESELDGVEADYAALDDLIDEAKKRIEVHPPFMDADASATLAAIADLLVDNGFIMSIYSSPLLAESLQPEDMTMRTVRWAEGVRGDLESTASAKVDPLRRKMATHILVHGEDRVRFVNCHTLALLYLSIGEALGLPFRAVSGPKHMFVRWHFADDRYLNWEATTAEVQSDEECVVWLGIDESAVKAGVYLRSLNETETLATVFAHRAEVSRAKGEYAEVLADLDTALEMNPRLIIAWYKRGVVHQATGHTEEAFADFSKVIDLDPGFAAAHVSRGALLEMQGEEDRAMEAYNKAIAIDPFEAMAYSNRGKRHLKEGAYESAIADLTRAIEVYAVWRQHAPRDYPLPDFYYSRSVAYRAIGRHDEAMGDLNDAISLDPDCAPARWLRGEVYRQRGETSQALGDFDRAIAADPAMKQAYLSRCATRYAIGEYDAATSDATKAIELDPDYSDAYYTRACCRYCRGQYTRARMDLSKYEELGGTPDTELAGLLKQAINRDRARRVGSVLLGLKRWIAGGG